MGPIHWPRPSPTRPQGGPNEPLQACKHSTRPQTAPTSEQHEEENAAMQKKTNYDVEVKQETNGTLVMSAGGGS